MPLAKLKSERFSLEDLRPVVNGLVEHIVAVSTPETIYLIGSAARGEFTAYSDLDFVIVYPSERELARARESLHLARPHRNVAVDFISLDRRRFDEMSDVGGIAHEAKHQGVILYKGVQQ